MTPRCLSPNTTRGLLRKLAGQPAGRRKLAFTLIELLLAVTLVMLLVGALVFSFSDLKSNAQLEEGTVQLEGLLRFARAHAANTGRRVQLVFDEASTNSPATSGCGVRLTWEPDPLGQPGHFEDLSETGWQFQGFDDSVEIEDVHHPGRDCHSGNRELPEEITGGQKAEAGLTEPFAPITFYPDGSCESAAIILASRVPERERRMSVKLEGITGCITHRLVETNEVEDAVESQSDAPKIADDRGAP